MRRLEFLRRDKKLSQRELGKAAGVNASYICNAEKRGMELYPNQARRLADALAWHGEPAELFKEVKTNELHT